MAAKNATYGSKPLGTQTTLEANFLSKIPRVVTQLGEQVFLKLPLYEAANTITPTYINANIFQKIFHTTCSWKEQSELISNLFRITIDRTQSTGRQVGWAYVDKQGEDAFGCALVGNQGSGRAYYTGTFFNIKGEKTPLATSAIKRYSDGVLKTESAIWSTLIGNTFYEELATHSSPILAILELDEERCKIVRIDEHGSLNKITHLFYKPHPLSEQQLIQTAEAFGRLEAEKFIHRILHGAWSAGNISLAGHLIDYDSVCAVKGRQPQFCYTAFYPDNYFGFEYEGQLLVLKDMVERPAINANQVPFNFLKEKLLNRFQIGLAKGLFYLMGFPQNEDFYEAFKIEINELANLFHELSHYCFYQSKQSLYTDYPSHLFFHLFDFSAFFRIYPLLKLSGSFSLQTALSVLIYSPCQQDMIESGQNHVDEDIILSIKNHFSKYLMCYNEKIPDYLEKNIIQFIIHFDDLFNLILNKNKLDLYWVASRAYKINEDRFYLFPVFSLEHLLRHHKKTKVPEITNRFIARLIKASQRAIHTHHPKEIMTDMRLFLEGYVYLLLNPSGFYQVVIHLDKDRIDIAPLEFHDHWQIQVQNQLIDAECQSCSEFLEIKTIPIPFNQLTLEFTRDRVFMLNTYFLYCSGDRIKLRDLFFPDDEAGYYL